MLRLLIFLSNYIRYAANLNMKAVGAPWKGSPFLGHTMAENKQKGLFTGWMIYNFYGNPVYYVIVHVTAGS